jgi:hypothetical protein
VTAPRNLNTTFGFQQRSRQVYLKAKALADSGGIGKIRLAHAHWLKGAVPPNVKATPKPLGSFTTKPASNVPRLQNEYLTAENRICVRTFPVTVESREVHIC